jgi:hypothetical protein
VSLAVVLGGVDEVHATGEGMQQGVDGGLVVDLAPLPAELPSSESDFADFPAGPAEVTVLHRHLSFVCRDVAAGSAHKSA